MFSCRLRWFWSDNATSFAILWHFVVVFSTVFAEKWLRSCPNLLHLSLFSCHLHWFCTHNVTTLSHFVCRRFVTTAVTWLTLWLNLSHTSHFIIIYMLLCSRFMTDIVITLSHILDLSSFYHFFCCHVAVILLEFVTLCWHLSCRFASVCAENVTTFATLCCHLVAIMWWFYFHHTYCICHMPAYPPVCLWRCAF